MIFREEKGDLFELKDTHLLVHCISRDCVLGAGIASRFRVYFPEMANSLFRYMQTNENAINRKCLLYNNSVANLITKDRYFNKPTYESMRESIQELREIIIRKQYTKIAMPRIGCGLDKLVWRKVKLIIQEELGMLDIEVVVRIY